MSKIDAKLDSSQSACFEIRRLSQRNIHTETVPDFWSDWTYGYVMSKYTAILSLHSDHQLTSEGLIRTGKVLKEKTK
jgi:hypothetical protein